jgi:hypothetical protein
MLRVPFIVRGVLSYRICRCVALCKITDLNNLKETIDAFISVGYNTRSSRFEVKNTIVKMMKSVGKAGGSYSPLIVP